MSFFSGGYCPVEGMPPEGDHHLIDDFYISGRRHFMPPLHLEPAAQGPAGRQGRVCMLHATAAPDCTKDGHDRFVPSF